MKLKFKHQKFQADAAKAVVDVFEGQPYYTPSYIMDPGKSNSNEENIKMDLATGQSNYKIVPELTDSKILENINKVQRANQIAPSSKLEGRYNLTIEMETGVGKTYTYIKTMYELNRAYGWRKFIIIVPSVAIREGVYKSFEMTCEHFKMEYQKTIDFFIYDSSHLEDIDHFASDSSIKAMIINFQAFNTEDRLIAMEQPDRFRSRKPIDVIAKTNPIIIIDEPQSADGEKTREFLKKFNALFTLRYSATHKNDSKYNMVYSLDAIAAYNKRLVKKISVKGIREVGSTATDSYIYVDSINLSEHAPKATIEFDVKSKNGIKRKNRIVEIGDNLYDLSNGLDEYKNNFIVKQIDGRDDSVEFLNGTKLFVGDIIGSVDDTDTMRRIQIRGTILSHIEKERKLFRYGIKVLSLFFIDKVANYRQYDKQGNPENGKYAKMFEEEYEDIINNFQFTAGDEEYIKYLNSIPVSKTHDGYFSEDKGKMVDGKIIKKNNQSNDVSAYDLIMKRKELLLDLNPFKSPVRFIFSHSALREGWDNPNVFQICTLKQSNSTIKKRQEVGRGMRLCVNKYGERMDENVLGNRVHDINVLTVIASESYEMFSKGLQKEIAEDSSDRPRTVTVSLFEGRTITDTSGNKQIINKETAESIHYDMIVNGYIDKKGVLTDKYYDDKANGNISFSDNASGYEQSIIEILDSVYNENAIVPENARSNNIELKVNDDKLNMPEFKALWEKINSKSVYVVEFDSNELIKKSIAALDSKLRIQQSFITIEQGSLNNIDSKESLLNGSAFVKEESESQLIAVKANSRIKYDLVGKMVENTGLTRKDVIAILQGIQPAIFNQFKYKPEEFIIKASELINNEKATSIIEHITYNVLDERYDTNIFTDPTIKGKLDINAIKTKKHIYDHVVYDSENERKFAIELDAGKEVAVYVKLPDGFYISTPVGKYNPDWAIAFYEGTVKHIYFVAETKGSMMSMQLRDIEKAKIHCAKEHFKAISEKDVIYDVVTTYDDLLKIINK